jgi:hypothetical protein
VKPVSARHRKDTTSKVLIAAVQQLGARYLPLDGVIDGLIETTRGDRILVDWKTPGKSLTDAQIKLVAAGWDIRFISTVDQLQSLLTRS